MVPLELVEDRETPGPRVEASAGRKPAPMNGAVMSMNQGDGSRRSHAGPGADQRQTLLSRASELHSRARQAAEQGDIASAARTILEALDCERRAGGLGPQVLQLIKPR